MSNFLWSWQSFLSLLLVVTIYHYITTILEKSVPGHTPGPIPLPFFLGNVREFSKDRRARFRRFMSLAKQYGSVCKKTFPGGIWKKQYVVVITDPALIREMLVRKEDFKGRNPSGP